jgi:aspartate kinase
VDGVYTADPRVVPAARRIGTLSYEETQELAEAGARVLNAQAVEFAKEQRIAIYARATASPLPGPDPSADGTVVRLNPPRMPGRVAGIAGEKELLVIESTASPQELFAALDELGVAGKQLHLREQRATMVVSRENLHEEANVRRVLRQRFGDSVSVVDGLGAVSAVGAGINATFENVRAGSAALADAGIVPGGVATSSFRITWIVSRARLDDAVRVLHRTFLEEPAAGPL